MGKMLALAMVEALLCARLSREGDDYDDGNLYHGGRSNHTLLLSKLLKRVNPDFARWTVVGLVAWGIGCGSHVPGVYTNVHHYKQWINSIN